MDIIVATCLFHAYFYRYFLGIPEHKPSQQHLYRVSAILPQRGLPTNAPECLTCTPSLVEEANFNSAFTQQLPQKAENPENSLSSIDFACRYHTALFPPSTEPKYVLITCHGPSIPTANIYRVNTAPSNTTLDDRQENAAVLEIAAIVQNNTQLKMAVQHISMPRIRTFPVMISGGYRAQVRLYLPPVLREDEITQYATVLHVYSAPGSQLVTDQWRVDYNTYLAGSKDYIVIEIDGRGSGGQGYQLLHEIYRRLGTVEAYDQLEVSEYLRDSLHFIDSQRMGIWGQSFGGYMAGAVLSAPQSIFQCGISVSPMTSWKLYSE